MLFLSIKDVERLVERDHTLSLYVLESACMPDSRQHGSAWAELLFESQRVMRGVRKVSGVHRTTLLLRKTDSKTLHVTYGELSGPDAAAMLRAVEHIPSVKAEIEGGALPEPHLVRWSAT